MERKVDIRCVDCNSETEGWQDENGFYICEDCMVKRTAQALDNLGLLKKRFEPPKDE